MLLSREACWRRRGERLPPSGLGPCRRQLAGDVEDGGEAELHGQGRDRAPRVRVDGGGCATVSAIKPYVGFGELSDSLIKSLILL
jgi:hypothetical protein